MPKPTAEEIEKIEAWFADPENIDACIELAQTAISYRFEPSDWYHACINSQVDRARDAMKTAAEDLEGTNG